MWVSIALTLHITLILHITLQGLIYPLSYRKLRYRKLTAIHRILRCKVILTTQEYCCLYAISMRAWIHALAHCVPARGQRSSLVRSFFLFVCIMCMRGALDSCHSWQNNDDSYDYNLHQKRIYTRRWAPSAGLYGFLDYGWRDTSVDRCWKIGLWNPAPQHFHLLLHSSHRYFTQANLPSFSSTDAPNLHRPGNFRTDITPWALLLLLLQAQHNMEARWQRKQLDRPPVKQDETEN